MRNAGGPGGGIGRRLVIGLVVVLAACEGPAPSTTPAGTPPATASATASPAAEASAVHASGGPGPNETAAPSGDETWARLTEVLYHPIAGTPAFVEVGTAGPAPVNPAALVVRVAGRELPLAGAGTTLAQDEQVMIHFDGGDRTEPGIVHAPLTVTLSADRGVVELLSTSGALIDRVAWGPEPGAVAPGPGGLVPEHVAEGSSIGRPPGAMAPHQRLDWVVYASPLVSPGTRNPVAPVEILLPLDGAILDEPGSTLSWYGVVGAAQYRIQVTAGPSFSSPVVDTTVTEPAYPVGGLAPGAYLWRVSPIGADGAAGPFSTPSAFWLEGPASAAVTARLASLGGSAALAATPTSRRLTVPYLTQHKDTRMLLLESPVESGQHAWDNDHGRPSAGDPADTKNCAIAAVAIMNRHFGGDMSQDRLGFEILHGRAPVGPEGDLMWGTGLTVQDATTLLDFALGGGVSVTPAYQDFSDFFEDARRQIDAGRPVMAANARHTFVITGYRIRNDGHRILYISDPANGRYQRDLDAQRADPADYTLWTTPEHPTARHQEPGVTRDGDGDGVVDFDETQRFRTNPAERDSDGDELPDKADIVTGVFDPLYGYALHPGAGEAGRDFDGDGLPTERDKDSDEGVCWDGEEDVSGNGHRNGAETYNFDTSDDVCMAFRITIVWSETYGGLTDTFTFEGVADQVDPNALGGVLFLTGSGTVEGSRLAWAACSVDIDAPSGKVAAFFGATLIEDTVTVGAFASEGSLMGVNTRQFEMPKDGGTQYFSGDGAGSLCPYSWAAKVTVEALLDH